MIIIFDQTLIVDKLYIKNSTLLRKIKEWTGRFSDFAIFYIIKKISLSMYKKPWYKPKQGLYNIHADIFIPCISSEPM